MTPGARVSAAITILDNYLQGQSENKVLLTWFRGNRFAGSKDRLAIRDLVFNCLRFKLSSSWPFIRAGLSLDGRVLSIGMLKISGECLDVVFDGKKYSPRGLSKLEEGVIQNFEKVLLAAPAFVRLNFPKFLEQDLKNSFADKFFENMDCLNTQADLFIRVNSIKATVESVIRSLKDEDIEVELISTSTNGLKVISNKKKIERSGVYLAGQIEIQDIHSQAAIEFINPKRNIQILDYCAGSGGKILAIASFTSGKARFFAHDISSARLKNLQIRCMRAGFDVKVLIPSIIKSATHLFDLVVVDVPCSGTGVWRRNPGDKWSLSPDSLHTIVLNQKKILKNAAAYVKDGGMLAYITCSILGSENRDQINWFLSRDRSFSFNADKFMPPVDGGDGFFVALLTKSSK